MEVRRRRRVGRWSDPACCGRSGPSPLHFGRAYPLTPRHRQRELRRRRPPRCSGQRFGGPRPEVGRPGLSGPPFGGPRPSAGRLGRPGPPFGGPRPSAGRLGLPGFALRALRATRGRADASRPDRRSGVRLRHIPDRFRYPLRRPGPGLVRLRWGRRAEPNRTRCCGRRTKEPDRGRRTDAGNGRHGSTCERPEMVRRRHFQADSGGPRAHRPSPNGNAGPQESIGPAAGRSGPEQRCRYCAAGRPAGPPSSHGRPWYGRPSVAQPIGRPRSTGRLRQRRFWNSPTVVLAHDQAGGRAFGEGHRTDHPLAVGATHCRATTKCASRPIARAGHRRRDGHGLDGDFRTPVCTGWDDRRPTDPGDRPAKVRRRTFDRRRHNRPPESGRSGAGLLVRQGQNAAVRPRRPPARCDHPKGARDESLAVESIRPLQRRTAAGFDCFVTDAEGMGSTRRHHRGAPRGSGVGRAGPPGSTLHPRGDVKMALLVVHRTIAADGAIPVRSAQLHEWRS